MYLCILIILTTSVYLICVAEWKGQRDGSQPQNHVSRLGCIKEAVTRHIDHLVVERPNCRIGFITFGSSVKVLGNTTTSVNELSGSALSNYDDLLTIGQETYKTLELKELKDSVQ